MSVRIPVGWQDRGLCRMQGTVHGTRCFVAAGLPLFPVHGVIFDGGHARPAPMRGRSVALAYLGAWGIVATVVAIWYANKVVARGAPSTAALATAIAVPVLTVGSWFFGRGMRIAGPVAIVASFAIPLAAVYYFGIAPMREHSTFQAAAEARCGRGDLNECESLASALEDSDRTRALELYDRVCAAKQSGFWVACDRARDLRRDP